MHVLNRSLCLLPSACFPVSRNRFEMYLDRSLDDGKLVSVYPQDVIESRCLDCCLCFSEIPLFRFRFPVKPHFPTTSSISFILCMIAVLYE